MPGDFWPRYEAVAARLLPPLGPGDGFSEEEVSAAEVRLNLRLPRILREFYLKAGNREDINRAHNRLLAPDGLVEQDGVLVFYEENQAVVLWGIEASVLGLDDPPVVSAGNGGRLLWQEEREHLSAFLTDMLLWQAVNGQTLYGGIGRASSEAVARAGSEWQQIGLGPSAGGKALLRDGQLLYVVSRDPTDAAPEVFGGGRTTADLVALTQTFSVAWDYSALDDEETEQEEADGDE